MRQSELFTKAERHAPKDEVSLNAQLLTRAGFVRKVAAGVYSYLPLGFRVLQKINGIIREEMNALGATEVLMSTLVPKEMWEASKRWETPVMFKTHIGSETNKKIEFGLGWTHEEVATFLAKQFIFSYKDLPKGFYQIQTKFRAEERAKSGLLRGREFMMKDLYSFHADKADLDAYYARVLDAYAKILARLGLEALVVEAGGGPFTKEPTHELQVIHPIGEDVVFYCPDCDWAKNSEVFTGKEGDKCEMCGKPVKKANGVEVANVFRLGTRYSDAFGLTYLDAKGKKNPVVMGSYGIGPSRMLGVLAEIKNDEKGFLWPKSVAPFDVHLVELAGGNGKEIYEDLQKAGVEVLYDERELSAGEKLVESDLIGIPVRAVVSAKTGEKVEVKLRKEDKAELMSRSAFLAFCKKRIRKINEIF